MYAKEIQALERRARKAMYKSWNSNTEVMENIGAKLAHRWYMQAQLIRLGHSPKEAIRIEQLRIKLYGYEV